MKIPTVKWAWYLDPRNIEPPYKRLCLRISYAGSRYFQRFDPTIKVTDEQWELLSKLRQGQNITKKMLNDALYTQEQLNELQGIVAAHERRLEGVLRRLSEYKSYTIEDVKHEFSVYVPVTEQTLNVRSLFESYLAERISKRKTKEFYMSACNHICKFYVEISGRHESAFRITDVTESFLRQYSSLGLSSVVAYKRHLRTIYNYARAKGLISQDKLSPFRGNVGKMESKNIALSTAQMAVLFGGSGYTPKQQMAVDFLHIAYWLNGANFADIANLKRENIDNNHIVFSRLKTKGRSRIEIRVKLTKALKELIKKYENKDKSKGAYLFPFLIDCPTDEESISKKIDAEKHLIMHALAKVKAKLGLTELNFNVIRHTFATQTYYSTNHDLYGVCKALGHNDIRTTQNYLDSIVVDGTEEPITRAKEELLNQFIKE